MTTSSTVIWLIERGSGASRLRSPVLDARTGQVGWRAIIEATMRAGTLS